MAAIAPTSTTFADYFREESNDANRNQHVAVAALFDPAAANNRTHAELLNAIVQHPDNMCILRVSTAGTVEVLHHIRRMPTPITGGGALAGTVLALSGDIDPDLRSATAVTFEDAHLRRATANALVPTSAHLTALLANRQGADADDLIDVPANQAADGDWEEHPARRVMYAPNWVAAMVIGLDPSPAAVWRTVGAAIVARPDAADYELLLVWMRSACIMGTGAGAGRSRVSHTDPTVVRMDGLVARSFGPVLKACFGDSSPPAAKRAKADDDPDAEWMSQLGEYSEAFSQRMAAVGFGGLVEETRGRPDIAEGVASIEHPAAPMLEKLRTEGAAVEVSTPPLSQEELAAAAEYGSHGSCVRGLGFICKEMVDFIRKGFYVVLP